MTVSPEPSPGRRRRLPILTAAAAAVLVAGGAVAVVGPRLVSGERPGPVEVAAPPVGQPTASTTATASGRPDPYRVRCMGELADAVAAASADPVTTGKYTFVHSRWWGEDATSSKKGGTIRQLATYESMLWRASDGSGRQDVIAIPGEPSRPDSSSTYTRGGLAGVLPEPIPTSPDVLAAQLATHQPPQMGPQWVLRGVADVYHSHATPQPLRVALLRVLAGQTTGLQCEGTTVDRAGRTGIAVAVNSDSNKVRDRLIFDPVTGRLFAAEQVFLRNPPALSGPTPRSYTYWLYLQTNQVDHLPAAYRSSTYTLHGERDGWHA